MNNLSTLPNEEARPEVDEMLHDYFQSEMPHPWPAFQTPRTMRTKTHASLWSRTGGRLALAGSIALLVLGYLALGAFFPRSQTKLDNETQDIGHREKSPKKLTLPVQAPERSPIDHIREKRQSAIFQSPSASEVADDAPRWRSGSNFLRSTIRVTSGLQKNLNGCCPDNPRPTCITVGAR
jgi:hypothetical protein